MGNNLKARQMSNLVVNRNDQMNFYLGFLLGIPVKEQKSYFKLPFVIGFSFCFLLFFLLGPFKENAHEQMYPLSSRS